MGGAQSASAPMYGETQPGEMVRSAVYRRFCGDRPSSCFASHAFSAGIFADIFGMAWAFGSIAALTFLSGAIAALVMREKAQGSLDLAQSIEPNVGVKTELHDNRIG